MLLQCLYEDSKRAIFILQGVALVHESTTKVRWSGTSSGRQRATIVSARWGRCVACPSPARPPSKAAAQSCAMDTVAPPPTTAVSRYNFASGLSRFRPARQAHPGLCFQFFSAVTVFPHHFPIFKDREKLKKKTAMSKIDTRSLSTRVFY